MLRFLGFCITISILYLFLVLLDQSDNALIAHYSDYIIETSLLAISIMLCLLLCLILSVIYLFNILLSFPKSILRKIKSIKADRNLSKLSEALSCLLVGNKKLAISSYNKISGSSLSELKDLYNIVSSEIATDPEERISILLNLADKKPFSYFAYKRLSQIFRELERYDQEGECLEQIGESVSLESRSS